MFLRSKMKIFCTRFEFKFHPNFMWPKHRLLFQKIFINFKFDIKFCFEVFKSFFLLPGHKVGFIAPCGANKSIFWPHSRKKIVYNTGKTFILLVWLLLSLCSDIKLHTHKINFFFPSCTMYYYDFTKSYRCVSKYQENNCNR